MFESMRIACVVRSLTESARREGGVGKSARGLELLEPRGTGEGRVLARSQLEMTVIVARLPQPKADPGGSHSLPGSARREAREAREAQGTSRPGMRGLGAPEGA